jgi:hypothetical protein
MIKNNLLMASSLIQTTMESLDFDQFTPQVYTLQQALDILAVEMAAKGQPDCPECGYSQDPLKQGREGV